MKLNKFICAILLLAAFLDTPQVASAWSKNMKPLQMKVKIESPKRYYKVPYSIELDFGRMLKEKGIEGEFDRFSVRVQKITKPNNELEDVHFNLSDDFLYGSKGKLNWLIDDTDETEYIVEYNTREQGPFRAPKYIGLVGNGDCLHFNDNRLHPLHQGMSANPTAVDWDGDGKTDIISPQIYTFTRESPRFCLRFFRNEGTNKRPVFGEGIPLRYRTASGFEFIQAGLSVEVLDWDGDGLQDILTVPYWGGAISVYRNTGEKDNHGLPILEAGEQIPVSAGSYAYIKTVDWHGKGAKSVLVGYMKETNGVGIDDALWFDASEEEKQAAQWPRWYYKSYIDYYENKACAGEPVRLAPPVRLKTADGKDISWYIASSFECTDWDGDGKDELLVLCNSDKMDKGYTGIRIYKNTGGASRPVFEDCGLIKNIKDRSFMYFHMVNTAAFKGLMVAPGSAGGKMVYYPLKGRDKSGFPVLGSKRFILQRNAYLNSYSGYAQASVADWDGDGGHDFTMGCETGWITRCADIGRPGWPMWSDPVFMKQKKTIELLNGPWSDPGSFMEGVLGQTAPMYVDWDCNGKMDLIVAIGRKLLLYANLGTSADPKLADPVEIRTADGNPVKVHRDKPAIVDWNGDGLPDIVGTDGTYECLFLRYRDSKTGELKLAEGLPLRYADGSRMGALQGFINAADWNNNGKYDLFGTAWEQVLHYKNTGSNAEPAFAPPVNMEIDGRTICVGAHVTAPVPIDWDKSGRQDLIMTGESGLIHLYRRNYLDGIHNKITYNIEMQ